MTRRGEKMIKDLCIDIIIRNNNSKERRNKELDKVKLFVRVSDSFKGRKRKLIKDINKLKKKKLRTEK